MTLETLAAGLLAVALIIYLLYTLLHPESF
jgi:K+-transporting ATPase KdpF subunit